MSKAISDEMKEYIEQLADKLVMTSPLRTNIESGTFSERALALYLESLRYLFKHTEQNINAAVALCADRPLTKAYLETKASEEQNHDAWAINDLVSLSDAAKASLEPSENIVKLVEFQNMLIQIDPVLFVAYAQWTEHFSVYVGEAWLDGLSRSGFQRDRVTAISNHLGPDVAHAAAGFRELDALADEAARVQGKSIDTVHELMLNVVNVAAYIFSKFCKELHEQCV